METALRQERTIDLNREALHHAMDQRGISASELARRAGITPETIWRAMRGYPVRPRTALRLANTLDAIPIAAGIDLLRAAPDQPRVVRVPKPRRPLWPDEGEVPDAVDGLKVIEERPRSHKPAASP